MFVWIFAVFSIPYGGLRARKFCGFFKWCRWGSELRCEVSNCKFNFVGFAGIGAASVGFRSLLQHGCDGVGGRATFNARNGGAQSSQPFRIAGNVILFWYKFCERRTKRGEKGYGHCCKSKFTCQSRGVMLGALNPICSSWKNLIWEKKVLWFRCHLPCVENQATIEFM